MSSHRESETEKKIDAEFPQCAEVNVVEPYFISLENAAEFNAAVHLYRQYVTSVEFLLFGLKNSLNDVQKKVFHSQIAEILSWNPKRIEELAKTQSRREKSNRVG